MAKITPEGAAVRELLTDYLQEHPNTPLSNKIVVSVFGVETSRDVSRILAAMHRDTVNCSLGRKRGDSPNKEFLARLQVGATNTPVVKGLVYRTAHATYVYDTEAFFRTGRSGGIKRNQFPVYHGYGSIDPPQIITDAPEAAHVPVPEPVLNPHPDEQLQLPFPASGGTPEAQQLAEAIIETDRENRQSGRLFETPPTEQHLPFFGYPADVQDPNQARMLARGAETIVVQTATEVITATIIVAVPR